MEVIRIFKLLIICLFSFFVSCKKNIKNENIIPLNKENKNKKILVQQVDLKERQNQSKKLIKDFYTSYLSYLNDDVDQCNLEKYLSSDFMKYLNRLDYDGIIFAQDYEKFDLNKLKVSDTQKDKVYKVEFINMEVYEKVVYAKVKLIDNSYKITNLTTDFEKVNIDNALSDSQTDEYDFDFLKYNTDPDDPFFSNIYTIEDFDSNSAIFIKVGKDESYEYFCIKKKTKEGLKLYYKEDSKYNEYNGDTSSPLLILYKKGEDFYVKSSLIKEGKEVKFKERDR